MPIIAQKNELLWTPLLLSYNRLLAQSQIETLYLSYTIYYIDQEWTLQSHCLQTLYLPEDHTASNLAEGLEETLRSWSLDVTRQACIITDSASNIKRATEDLGW